MLNLIREDGGVFVNVDLYREREIENNVINIIINECIINCNLIFICDDFFSFFFWK